MENNMKTCICCKTPVESVLAIETAKGPVHPGPCLNKINENESLNESTDVDEIQMIM